jgi:hypothetical protein
MACMCPVVTQVLEAATTKALPGRLAARKQYIFYVEGDREFVVDREMPLEAFAQKNAGRYLVTTVEWNGH